MLCHHFRPTVKLASDSTGVDGTVSLDIIVDYLKMLPICVLLNSRNILCMGTCEDSAVRLGYGDVSQALHKISTIHPANEIGNRFFQLGRYGRAPTASCKSGQLVFPSIS
jgi:hypothetical protein